MILGLSQSFHRHPADFQPAQNHDFQPEVTLQTTWLNLVVKQQTQKKKHRQYHQQQQQKIGGFVALHINLQLQTEDKMSHRTKRTLKHMAFSALVDGGWQMCSFHVDGKYCTDLS